MTHDKSGCPALSSLHQVATAIRSEYALARSPCVTTAFTLAQSQMRTVRDNNATTVVAFTESCARALRESVRGGEIGGNYTFKLDYCAAVPGLYFTYAVVKAPQ